MRKQTGVDLHGRVNWWFVRATINRRAKGKTRGKVGLGQRMGGFQLTPEGFRGK